MEPQKNARNIPATPMRCQGKNVWQVKEKGNLQKDFAPDIVYGLRRSGANGLVEIASLLQLLLQILCPSRSGVGLCCWRNGSLRWGNSLLSVRFLGRRGYWFHHTFYVGRRRL